MIKVYDIQNCEMKNIHNNNKISIVTASHPFHGVEKSSDKTLYITTRNYLRQFPDKTCFIYLYNPIKECYRCKLSYCKSYFKPKDETIKITTFMNKMGVLKLFYFDLY